MNKKYFFTLHFPFLCCGYDAIFRPYYTTNPRGVQGIFARFARRGGYHPPENKQIF